MTLHQTTIRPAVTAPEQRFLDLYAEFAARLPGGTVPQIRAWRDAALDQFALLGLPHRRVEEWKYTDLRSLMAEVYPLAGLKQTDGVGVGIDALIGKSLADIDAYRAVFVNGRFNPTLSTVQQADGVTFQPLSAAMDDESGVARLLSTLPIVERDAIALLSTAFATDGAILNVEADAKVEKPVHLIFASTGDSPNFCAYQNAIAIGEGAQISLIETHAAEGQSQTIALTRLAIASNAALKHVRVNTGPSAKHLSSIIAKLGEKTEYDPLQLTVDGAVTRAQANIRFEGQDARCHYTGTMMLRRQSHADFTLIVEHAAVGCESRELVKAVLDGRSRGVFQGKVIVERGAQKTDGKQMANALLLSDDAEFDSKPELEIYADDVACGHGATAGQLDEDLMFYLRARGIPEAEARALLIAAFVGEALEKVDNEALRYALEEKANAWLSTGEGVL